MPSKEMTAHDAIDTILERHEQRQRSTDIFPPDFVHGSVKLQELYERFGDWAENVTFLRATFADGILIGASVAYFDDWFLTIEHAESGTADVSAWIEAQTTARTSVVEFCPSGRSFRFDDDHWIVIASDEAMFRALEREILDVTRDAEARRLEHRQSAQVDLLSLVCLCARLGK